MITASSEWKITFDSCTTMADLTCCFEHWIFLAIKHSPISAHSDRATNSNDHELPEICYRQSI
jgi:hypothetical protein